MLSTAREIAFWLPVVCAAVTLILSPEAGPALATAGMAKIIPLPPRPHGPAPPFDTVSPAVEAVRERELEVLADARDELTELISRLPVASAWHWSLRAARAEIERDLAGSAQRSGLQIAD